MRVIDVTLPLRGDLPVWPGEPQPSYEPIARMMRGAPADVTRLLLGSHTGTHVDPPSHFIPGGKTVDEIDPDVLVGPAFVADLRGNREIDRAALEGASVPSGVERLLLRTDNEAIWGRSPTSFADDYVALALDGADWAIGRGLRLIGIDYLSIERSSTDEHPVHRRLLGAGVLVVEGLLLRDVAAGHYDLFCGPLKLPGLDGAPARVLLVPRNAGG